MPLPPLWALGYHQCRYSYYPESKVRFIADNFRERQIPADVIWLDIHYQDGYAPFTWDATRFPDPARLIADLRAAGLPAGHHRRRAHQEAGGHAAVRQRARRPTMFAQEPRRLGLRRRPCGRRNAEKNPGAERVSRLQQAGRARVVGRALQAARRRRRRRHLERHERAGRLRQRRPARCRSTCSSTTTASRPTTARSTTSTAC